MKLLVDEHNSVGISDKPIFGASVTLNEQLQSLIGKVLSAGAVIGWVNYIDVDQFACITDKQFYVAASDYLYTQQNQLIVSKPIKLHNIETNVNGAKSLFDFSEV